ncbi:hypothetical protein [Rhizobium leguminosarum]|uniref:hypothetical protein n=1 Tax=Rhizobium leguminosarum TaxID=384 RepID=UPI001C902D3A|nr:hypothetical protein [Rhizobium leguminosarum]MBY2997806.1 hypothetical protein [Rhizobium leguminosarum]
MASKDTYDNIKLVSTVVPAVNAAATVTGTTVDTVGFESATLLVNVGAVAGAGNVTLKLQHSDTTTDGDFVDVPAAQLLGVIPAVLVAATVYKQGYTGAKRYLRAKGTLNSGTSVAYDASFVLAHARSKPVA